MTGPLISACVTFSKFINITASFAVIGTLLAMAFLLLDSEGKLSTSAEKLRSLLQLSAIFWFIGNIGTIFFTLANILGQSFTAALDPTVIRSFLTQVTLGQYFLFQTLISVIALVSAKKIQRINSTIALLMLTIIGIIAPIFQSHAASSGSHSLAIGSLVIHVVGLSFWVGGIFALIFIESDDRVIAVPRFSVLALWSAIAVVVSGSANAWARLDFKSAWQTTYALVVIAKIVLTIALLAMGYLHRRNLSKKSAINWVSLGRLIMVEAFIMVSALALGAWLSSNRAPVRNSEESFNAALTVAGIETPKPPTVSRILLSYEPDALMIGLLVLAVALYIKGVIVLTKRGDKWPVGRTISFALGISVIDFATSGGLGLYAHFAFSYHMTAHMFLGMIAPIGIVLGAPITLALRTLPQGRTSTERGVRGSLISALHSRVGRFYTNPLIALAIFDGSLFALYFTSLFGGMMQSHAGHFFMNIHFILAGTLFFYVVVGIDPNPRKIPHLVRMVILLAAMSIHAFFSVALMSSTTLIDQGYFASLKTPWLLDLLADQNKGGAIGWAMGEIPILLALVATFIQWMRDDSREANRIDKNTARMAAMGQPDELAQYNQYLSELAKKEKDVR
ncbi:MAG: cytochrome c oxidase assembly protein [Actinobacteria bacterium]|nr:cytochrome c oxidase assembly protein [Actinomycetota bacterium]